MPCPRFIFGLLLAYFFASVTAASAQVIATEDRPSQITAARGMAMWSHYDAKSRLYRLRLFSNGVIRTVRVPGKSAPFDVDLGIDAAGHTLALYSRCRDSEPYPPSSAPCDLYQLQVATGKERKLRAVSLPKDSEFLPSLDGHRVAFARIRASSVAPIPHLIVYDFKTKQTKELRGGSRGVYENFGSKGEDAWVGGPGPTRIDLAGQRVALGWKYTSGPCQDEFGDFVLPDQVWLLSLRGYRRLVADANCQYQAYRSPALTDTGLIYSSVDYAASGRDGLTRLDLATGGAARAPEYSGVASLDGDEDLVFAIRATRFTSDTTYEVVRSTPRFEDAKPTS